MYMNNNTQKPNNIQRSSTFSRTLLNDEGKCKCKDIQQLINHTEQTSKNNKFVNYILI